MVFGKKALLLGAGFVCSPAVQALCGKGVHITVACRTLSAAQALAVHHKNTTAIELDASDCAALNTAISTVDIVISLIPYTLHALVVKAAINQQKPVVTTSYISSELWDLDAEAKSAGVTILNEIGLDPGIDHLYAVKTIDEVHCAGGLIEAFTSYCGALPAPENSDNPLGYKFSWSPRGGLLALLNPGQWYEGDAVTKVNGSDLMASAKPHHIFPGFNLVGYANRNAVSFRDFYNIPEAKTVFRGTLRYAGFPEIIRVLVDIGYFRQDELPAIGANGSDTLTWAQLTAYLLGLSQSATEIEIQSAITRKASFLFPAEVPRVLSGLHWMGLFSTTTRIDPRGTPLDTFCTLLEEKMAYNDGESDMVILQHIFDVINADGSKETRSSTLVEYGEPIGPGSRSAMAKLVGLPCSAGVLAVLEGRVKEKGMVAPWTSPQIASMLRDDLKGRYGIELKEKILR
ncbi:aminoadipic semialdehyde synthase [Penicillium angulare]|uniref:aminoadipic semialdehyde synthase n=1 Tax=Penicillium angulare TaxID=116970 RepID=UPI00253F764E|nr:aminoadipic semialdehyde synthase [Penicillium angulare]KAJ5267858.1 aminoadipic semialdehyde synthase [Penicillium angulare]